MSISRKARGPAVKLELDPTDLEWDDWEAVSLPKLLILRIFSQLFRVPAKYFLALLSVKTPSFF